MYQRAVLVNLPKSESLDIEFSNVHYTVSTGFRKPRKTILKGVEGCFKSGELTAIMGPSGAGKSSLLNILTGYQTENVTGNFKFRSKQGIRDWNQYRKESVYIQQDDMLHPLFTVEESMMMAADLKLGDNLHRKAKQMVIDDILGILDLTKTKDTRCDRLSGGQRKRLSIALELVDNPPVMFLDEPTTGLDSSASLQCVAMLQSLAKGGRTIICTIHQPTAIIYEMFDHVYLLAEGRCVYQGDAKNTVNYLKKVGLDCPKYHNPADYMIEVITKEYGDFNDRLASAANDRSWRASTPAKSILYHSDSVISKYNEEGKTAVLINTPSEFSRFLVLLNRCSIQLFRDWTVTHLKLVFHILVGILFGLFYNEAGSDGSKTINNISFMFVNSVYISYTSMMPAVLKFPLELPVLRKEHFNNWYKLRTYYLAVLCTNIPVQIFFSVVYSSAAYFLSGQPPDMERFFMFMGAVVLVSLASESLGLVLGTLLKNPIHGTFFGAIITATFLLFSGLLVLFTHMSRIMYYVTYTSYMRYSLEAMVWSVYGFNRPNLPCLPKSNDLDYCHYRIPSVILKELGMLDNRYWMNITILFFYLVICRIWAYCSLKNKLRKSE